MAYATTAQMIERFTEREVLALTDRANTGEIDETRLGAAIEAAGSEIDAHLGRRYTLPLTAAGVVLTTPPLMLTGLCCDIARYRLSGTEVQETDAIRNRYKDAINVLKMLGNGEMVFAEAPDLLPATSPNAGGGTVATNERCRLFGRETLGSY